ncbi:MAG: biotin/lipoyl-binding protein, partial [Pyrinomonadaceae bacterium]|nr:biotin/lipoyl-binding protein [Pyrinomonadaceae bacterium]
MIEAKTVEKTEANDHKPATDILIKPIVAEVKIVSVEEIEQENQRGSKKIKQQWIVRIIILAVVGVIVWSAIWYFTRPAKVTLIHPKQAVITETIASSGRVGGTTETNVGSQSQGIVRELNVKEGDSVIRGQEIALIKNDVAEAQISQARAAVDTAQAQLVQASRGALNSDIDSVMEQVRQANAQVEQQRAAITQTQKSVLQADAVLAQLASERDLAANELKRSKSLVNAGVISRSEYDGDLSKSQVAAKRVDAQKRSIEISQASVRSAQASLKSAQANVSVQQARLRTIQGGARSEDKLVAEQRVSEADKALQVAEKQAGNAVVTAPFAGTVTKINS